MYMKDPLDFELKRNKITKFRKYVGQSIVVVIVIVVILVLVLFLVVSSLILLKFIKKNSSHEKSDHGFRYRYYELNQHSNESSVGFMNFPEQLDSCFHSYFDEQTSNHILISSFDTIEYKCTGLCTCEPEPNNRRTLTIPVLSRLTYLLAAVSSVIALNVAKTHFDKECEESISQNDECPPNSKVFSEVEDCEVIHESSSTEKKTSSKEDEYFSNIKEYLCSGNCQKSDKEIDIPIDPNDQFFDEDVVTKMKHYAAIFNCDELELESELTVDHNKVESIAMEAFEYGAEERGEFFDLSQIDTARLVFGDEQLEPFCRRLGNLEGNSMGRYYELSPYSGICTAGVGDDSYSPPDNPTIVCVEK